ncbi:PilX N-terminal domain-containing pilus assembly protein [Pseudomonas sp. Bout1]|uniref:pilus assembly PilX family protein n=1 Tax=Pseudomonas sp. Bout1 TaxID=3048600 RepID=UPI002AB55CDC|nr:PilX N-terminal domain-containing pilus assembly protein [Pseudomonas sp. Bout1]MDY7535505.1 PilX N-terminal domain-containing pilus assembly protein [Pseudomonas sp. Bout1]MEB0187072.1 PilX N-terminal domain-containing pilus assembly protein [Pseudomonas sp. Bout1]
MGYYPSRSSQAGMVLLISLVFLLLLALLGLASMRGAISQEKITGSTRQRNQSFQVAESGLRLGESVVQAPGFARLPCRSTAACAPPAESVSVVGPGTNPVSTVTWVGMKNGLYGIQNLGQAKGLAHLPAETQANLYRVTSVGVSGHSRSVLESVYARVGSGPGERFRRIMWRQLQ